MARATTEKVELHSLADRVEIAPGVHMPRLGLGTSHSQGSDVRDEIRIGFSLGYRLVDTASMYGNEHDVGAALRETGVPRDEAFVTTKVWNSDQGYRSTLAAFEGSRERLGMDYVDLYLIHWPQRGHTEDTWRALEELRESGKVRAIGVCNFEPADFEELYAHAVVPPALNQLEFHPHMQRPAVQEYCRSHGITIQAWAPVMRGRASDVPDLAEIGRRHGKTGSQVAIRWILQKGVITIPKSVHEARLRENADVFDFELSDAEMAAIDALDRGAHAG